jgi:hypothetical protein
MNVTRWATDFALPGALVPPAALAQSAEETASGKQRYQVLCLQCRGGNSDA